GLAGAPTWSRRRSPAIRYGTTRGRRSCRPSRSRGPRSERHRNGGADFCRPGGSFHHFDSLQTVLAGHLRLTPFGDGVCEVVDLPRETVADISIRITPRLVGGNPVGRLIDDVPAVGPAPADLPVGVDLENGPRPD